MITVNTELHDYCQNCPHFEDEVNHRKLVGMDETLHVLTVTCTSYKLCDSRMKYLEQVAKNKELNKDEKE